MYIGVDPGRGGGLAFLSEEVELLPMPETEADIMEALSMCPNSSFAAIEKVGGFVPGGGNQGFQMFRFGHNYGSVRMALLANGIPFEEVTPRTWQKTFGVAPRAKNEKKSQFKARIKARAQELFPGVKITLKTCDALLIAEYIRRKRSR